MFSSVIPITRSSIVSLIGRDERRSVARQLADRTPSVMLCRMRVRCSAFLLVLAGATVSGARAPAASAQNGLVATLTFAKHAGTAIYLPIRVNGGRVGYWALDSGASECIIDRSIAQQAGLTTPGGRDIHGAGKGTVRLDSITGAVRLEIGGRSLFTVPTSGLGKSYDVAFGTLDTV